MDTLSERAWPVALYFILLHEVDGLALVHVYHVKVNKSERSPLRQVLKYITLVYTGFLYRFQDSPAPISSGIDHFGFDFLVTAFLGGHHCSDTTSRSRS